MVICMMPTAAFADTGGTQQSGKAVLHGFEPGMKAGDAYIENTGIKIIQHSKNPTNGDRTGQAADLQPFAPEAFVYNNHPDHFYYEHLYTAIIVQNADESGSQRRLALDDTFKEGMTYRFSFQDVSWPVSSAIKGGGYLGELGISNFDIAGGAKVVKVERVDQMCGYDTASSRHEGFFYDVWVKMPGTPESCYVEYAWKNVSVEGLTGNVTTGGKRTGKAVEGDRIKLTADKMKEGMIFTGWKFTADGKQYIGNDNIKRYCDLGDFNSSESGSGPVTCSFIMGDKDLKIEALYSATGPVTFNEIELNIMPPIKGGKPATEVTPVYNVNYGEAYDVLSCKWYGYNNETNKNINDKNDQYVPMLSNQTFDTEKCHYAMNIILKLNDRYYFDAENASVTVNGKTYTEKKPDYHLENWNRDSRYPVSFWEEDKYGKENYRVIKLYIPMASDKSRDFLYDEYNNLDYSKYAALNFCDPLTANINVDGRMSADNKFTVEEGEHTAAVRIVVPAVIRKYIDDGSVSVVPAILGLCKDDILGEDLWKSKPIRITDNRDGSRVYTYATAFNAAVGHTYIPVGGVNLVSKDKDTKYIASISVTGSVKVTPAKAVESRFPERPQLNAIKVGDSYTGFEIENFDGGKYEYVYTLNEKPDWNTDKKITSEEVTGLKEGQTYNVFVRYKETAAAQAGTGVSFNSVKLADTNYLSRLILSDKDGEYAPFDAGNTIYVKAGETKTLNVTKAPGNANSWYAFKFRPYNNASTLFSVSNGDVAQNAAMPEAITIKAGSTVGSEDLAAAYGINDTYGRWKVVVNETGSESSDGSGDETPGKETPGQNTENKVGYIDSKPTDWYNDCVIYVSKEGIMSGTSKNEFSPNKSTTRAMIVTILYRMERSPKAASGREFSDVAAGSWYHDAVKWAAANGIVTGYSDGTFVPNADITREQMAAILYRYCKYKGCDVSASADISAFTDAVNVSGYASESIKWANAAGLINGMGGGRLAPKGTATRAQTAAIIYRLCNGVIK